MFEKQWNGRWTFPLSQAWVFEPQFASAVKKRVVRSVQLSACDPIFVLFKKKQKKGRKETSVEKA